jgi:hypothetical protein
MKRTIKTAIKAAGLNADTFHISSDGQFYSDLDNTKKANAEARKVVTQLRKAGHRVSGFTTGYGLWIYDVNAYRHAGHDFDFNSVASVHHY